MEIIKGFGAGREPPSTVNAHGKISPYLHCLQYVINCQGYLWTIFIEIVEMVIDLQLL